MEMQITMIDAQTNAVAATSANGVNAKQPADTAAGSFKSALKKVLDDTPDKGSTASEQSEAAPSGDKTIDGQQDMLSASMLAGIAITVPAVVVPVSGQPVLASTDETAQGDVKKAESLSAVDTPLPQGIAAVAAPALPKANPLPEQAAKQQPDASLQPVMTGVDGVKDAAPPPVQEKTVTVNELNVSDPAATPQVEVLPAESQFAAQQPQNITGQISAQNAPVQQASVKPAETKILAENKPADSKTAMDAPEVTAAANAAESGNVPYSAQVEPATGEKNAEPNKEHTTNIVVPVAAATEQQTKSGHDLNADTAETPSSVTPLTAGQTAAPENTDTSFKKPEVPPPVKEQVFQSIVQRAKFMNNGTQQEIKLQLKPENLGTLNIQIAMENGAVTAKFQTDNPQVKQTLEASFHQLKQDLQSQGFKVQDVAVSIAQQGMSFSEFSRRSPQFSLIKSKRIDKMEESAGEQVGAMTSIIENYGGSQSGGVDYKV